MKNALITKVQKEMAATLSVDQLLSTGDLRIYLSEYQESREVSRITMDNIRRILSSFLDGWKMKTIY